MLPMRSKNPEPVVAPMVFNSEKYVHLNPSFDELIKVANLLQLSADDLILLSSNNLYQKNIKIVRLEAT